jgi:hypothetical protein
MCVLSDLRGVTDGAGVGGTALRAGTQRAADPTHLLEAHDVLGSTLFYLGKYAASRTHLEQGSTPTDLAAERALALHHGTTPGVRCLEMAAHTLWCLGYPAQAMRRSQEALAMAQALAHPYSLAVAQHFAAWLHQRRRDIPAVREQADALLSLALAQRFPTWGGMEHSGRAGYWLRRARASQAWRRCVRA